MSDIKDYTFVVEPEQRVIEVAIGGPQGASLVWAGEWNPETLYKGQYVVFYGGIAYVSLQNANLGNTPNPEGDAYWEPIIDGSFVEAMKDQAQASADAAAVSEVNASTSEANAAASETNALSSENKARQWAEELENVEVETGKYSALHHAIKASDAQTAAESAKSGAELAESNASGYASDASLSASNAATSEANAATSETNALASENKAHQWAEEAEDIEVQTGEYSAYHWAKKAEAAVLLAVEDQIVDGVTSKAPSQNAVYDALANKADIAYVNTELAAQIEDQIIDGITTKAASQNAIHDALVMLERKVGGGILI